VTNQDETERAYVTGHRRALIDMFGHFARSLHGGEVNLHRRLAALEAERLEAVTALRALCDVLGDNEWSDDLHLADVVNKHVMWPCRG
jgi:hypothetical protein